MTKIISAVVLALALTAGFLTLAVSANAAPISGSSDFAVHGYLGTAYGK
jgi:hypothetical protein